MAQDIVIRLKDGSERSMPAGSTYADLAAAISARLAKEAVAAKADGQVVDLAREIADGAQVELLTLKDPEGVDVMRHTCAHVMAQAVARLFPGTKFAIGPVIENGFYYDFADHDFTPEDLPLIAQEMQKIIDADYPVVREVISREDALQMFEAREDRFKVEIIRDLPAETTLTIYRQAEFVDLCRGPHLPSTGRIKVFQLGNLAGAYWRGIRIARC
ncbi:hypothetical protein GCM10025858_08720 [Alicyclobacillus sacchari]|nr:hypothetical protein GCM10025858_08720 [Alicyclobacillus sacchari]